MLWIKAFHIIAVVCWFSGVFYLPRLFVNHAMAEHQVTRDQLAQMEHKLYRFMTVFVVMTYGFGLWLVSYNWSYYSQAKWFYAKLALVLALTIYHLACGRHIVQLREGLSEHSHVYFRWFNELPVFILFAVVILVVVKPF
ncbi:MAG: putative membrane protein [Paraglaciecola psychrophila]|jgi:putative membrane protein